MITKPTVNNAAVSISTAILLISFKYSLNFSSYSQTLRLVVYTVPVNNLSKITDSRRNSSLQAKGKQAPQQENNH